MIAHNRTSSKAQTFLAECHTFMTLNHSAFPNNHFCILWVLQLCSDKVATWKQIQLELLETGTDVPNYLLDWDTFQKEYLLKWADMNLKRRYMQGSLPESSRPPKSDDTLRSSVNSPSKPISMILQF